MLQSSGGRGTIVRDAKFEWGMAPLPYWPDLIAQPKNGIVGGASLWVFNAPNRTDAELRGVAQFLDYLRTPEVLLKFAEPTGFVPPTVESFQRMQASGYFEKNPGTEVPYAQLTRGTPTANSLGYRFGRWTEIRDFYHEEVERALQGQITAKQALDNAVTRGNAALRQFERTAQ
jgi:sn-glycerol 3-phosphate transport system substrate-binding protein